MFTITHINRINTDLTCNCLLAPSSSWCQHKKTKTSSLSATDTHCSSSENTDDEANSVGNDDNLYFYAACYELGKTNTSNIRKNSNEIEIEEEENCEESDAIEGNHENESSASPMYRGNVIKYTYYLHSDDNQHHANDDLLNKFIINEMKDMTETATDVHNLSVFPGVFDLNYIPRSWTPFATKMCKEEPVLVASCTDGSVRMLNTLPQLHYRTEYTTYNSNSLENSHIYSNVAQSMITSTTPFLFCGNSVFNYVFRPTLHLLTTHHGGNVQVTNTHKQPIQSRNHANESLVEKEKNEEKIIPNSAFKENTIERESSSSLEQFHLHPHEYDAWCSCVLPLQSTSLNTHLQCICTGGDDGLLYFHDLRLCDVNDDYISHKENDEDLYISNTGGNNKHNNKLYASSVVAKVQFDAGVVSLAPVVEECSSSTSSSSLPQTNSINTFMSTNWNTPYLLAGCYDESISLLDIRQLTQTNYETTTVRGNGKKVNSITRKTNLGGGVWRCNRTLYPTYNNYNFTEKSEEQTEREESCFYGGYNNSYMNAVNTDNILVLPLMQRGAALLPYNVKLSVNDIFASEPIYFPFEQIQHNLLSESTHLDSSSNTEELLPSTSKGADEECLVYDVAVLHANRDCTQFIVASCSFYERAIDIWQVQC